jgi:hypothetical protein
VGHFCLPGSGYFIRCSNERKKGKKILPEQKALQALQSSHEHLKEAEKKTEKRSDQRSENISKSIKESNLRRWPELGLAALDPWPGF